MAGFTKLLVVSEVFFGIYFLTVLLSTQASWINTPPNIKEPDTFATLFPSKTE
jgi:hypothetical protein